MVSSVSWTKALWALRGNGALPSDGSLKSEVGSRGSTPFASQEEAGSCKFPHLVCCCLAGLWGETFPRFLPVLKWVFSHSPHVHAGAAQLVFESLSQELCCVWLWIWCI